MGRLQQHIVESNAIEGYTHEGLHQVNSERAARLVLLAAEEGTVLHPRILHAVVMEGLSLPKVDEHQHEPGEYRKCAVRVGHHVPPPASEVPELMDNWWDDIGWLPPWRSHVEFESIHPFPDGNGRVGRLVYWNEQLLWGEEPELFMACERQDYYDRLERDRQRSY